MYNWEHSAQTLSVRTEEKEIDLDNYKPGTYVYTWSVNCEETAVNIQRSIVTYLDVSWNSFGTISITCHFCEDPYASNYEKFKDDLVEEAIVSTEDCLLSEADVLKCIKEKGYEHLKIKKMYLNYPTRVQKFTDKYFKKNVKKFTETDRYYNKFEI